MPKKPKKGKRQGRKVTPPHRRKPCRKSFAAVAQAILTDAHIRELHRYDVVYSERFGDGNG